MHCMAGTWAFDLCLWVHFEVVVSERWIIGSRNVKSHYLCNDGDAMNRIFDTYHFLTSNHLSSLRPYESPTVEKKTHFTQFRHRLLVDFIISSEYLDSWPCTARLSIGQIKHAGNLHAKFAENCVLLRSNEESSQKQTETIMSNFQFIYL